MSEHSFILSPPPQRSWNLSSVCTYLVPHFDIWREFFLKMHFHIYQEADIDNKYFINILSRKTIEIKCFHLKLQWYSVLFYVCFLHCNEKPFDSYLSRCYQKLMFSSIFSFVVLCGHVWSSMVSCGLVQSCMVMYICSGIFIYVFV